MNQPYIPQRRRVVESLVSSVDNEIAREKIRSKVSVFLIGWLTGIACSCFVQWIATTGLPK